MTPRRPALSTLLAAISVATATSHAQHRADGGADAAPAPTVPSIELVVMNATHEPGGLDASLRGYTQLTRPPFSAFSRIQEVTRGSHPLSEGVPTRIPLPNGGSVQLLPTAGPQTSRASIAVTITLGGRTHQAQFSAASSVPFFLAHSTGVDSALILRFVPR
jgi:hypothetical protein